MGRYKCPKPHYNKSKNYAAVRVVKDFHGGIVLVITRSVFGDTLPHHTKQYAIKKYYNTTSRKPTRPYCITIQAILQCERAYITAPFSLNCNAKEAISQSAEYQPVRNQQRTIQRKIAMVIARYNIITIRYTCVNRLINGLKAQKHIAQANILGYVLLGFQLDERIY